MRLDQALVQQKLCESRQEAQELIRNGAVFVDGTLTTKQTKQVYGEKITITHNRKFVSRGGKKLEGALLHIYGTEDQIARHFGALRAIDIGSSTGGFTDCLLSHDVSSVTCIDVGSAQLHPRLRADKRISLFENTDIRNYKDDNVFDLIVADVSFISLLQILDTIISFGKSGSEYFLLIKPQFEVGKGNTKKGIVKDEELVTKINEKYIQILSEKGFSETVVFPCVIQGGDGNQEYFLYSKQ